MTRDELARLISEYQAGVEAEITLLHQLAEVSARQRAVTAAGDFKQFTQPADERDAIMRSLVTIEEGLRAVRHTLASHRQRAAELKGFDAVVKLHREATQLVNRIMATDQASLSALADADLARRSAVASLERGESTLAAYRRVLAPPAASATLVDRRG
jgi:hypothetical protein